VVPLTKSSGVEVLEISNETCNLEHKASSRSKETVTPALAICGGSN
jgi:hypothetical protein